MENTKTLYTGIMQIKLNAEVYGNELAGPFIQVPFSVFTDLPKQEKHIMQFSFHYPSLEKNADIIFQLDQHLYGAEESAFLIEAIQINECDFILQGFFIYSRDLSDESFCFDFAARYKAALPNYLKKDYTIPQ